MNTTIIKTPYEGKFNAQSGQVIDLLNPSPEMFYYKDIAHGLGHTCRFGGQINRFYSVAQHSVLVAHLAPESLRRAALLHDASEAYLGDVIKPLKVILSRVYEDIEEKFMRAICERFNEPFANIELISQYDKEAYELEKQAFKYGNLRKWAEMWSNIKEASNINIWPPSWAVKIFGITLEHYFGKEVTNV